MTVIIVTRGTVQRVGVNVQPIQTVIVTKKGDTGLSAYELAVQEGYEGTLEEWLDSLSVQKKDGAKSSAVDAGTRWDMSLVETEEADYLFICVKTGVAGEAVWKKTVLFRT